MNTNRMAKIIAMLFVLSGAPGLVAQSPNPSCANCQKLVPTMDTITVTVEAGGRTIPFATAFHSIRMTTRGSTRAWELAYRWVGNDGSRTADTLWIDAKTLAPLENHRHNGAQDATTTFDRSSAHTTYLLRGKAPQRADTTVTGQLHASGELEELIRASPLALGYGAKYTLFYGPPGQLARPGSFKVTRSEHVAGRDGQMYDCWVVDAPLSEGLNTFFVRKTDHRVIRLINHEDPSAVFVFVK